MPRQFAAFVIGALLSANVLSGNCNPALAGPPARSADAPAAAAPAAALPATQPRARVYVFRGALGPIFSRGMDQLTSRLEEAGVRADVYEFTICRLIAARAIRDYREDPVPITLIGHSMGGLCALIFADILRSENIPVSLVVTIDPAQASPKVPLNVERYINIFLSTSVLGGGDVVAEPGYQGHYASFDMKDHERSHPHQHRQDGFHPRAIGGRDCPARDDAGAEPGRDRAAALRRSARCSNRTLGQRHPAIRPFGRHAAAACGAQPRAAVVAHPGQSITGRCTADRWPARHHSAPTRAAGPAAGRWRQRRRNGE